MTRPEIMDWVGKKVIYPRGENLGTIEGILGVFPTESLKGEDRLLHGYLYIVEETPEGKKEISLGAVSPISFERYYKIDDRGVISYRK